MPFDVLKYQMSYIKLCHFELYSDIKGVTFFMEHPLYLPKIRAGDTSRKCWIGYFPASRTTGSQPEVRIGIYQNRRIHMFQNEPKNLILQLILVTSLAISENVGEKDLVLLWNWLHH